MVETIIIIRRRKSNVVFVGMVIGIEQYDENKTQIVDTFPTNTMKQILYVIYGGYRLILARWDQTTFSQIKRLNNMQTYTLELEPNIFPILHGCP